MKYFVLLLLSLNAYGADWTRVTIPDAKCGDGKPYSILLQNKEKSKLLVEFMGGGVCWDHDSCFNPAAIFPWLHDYPELPSYSVFTANTLRLNPFRHHSKIYFPYCTGDVHMGTHRSVYQGKEVYFYGRRNVDLTFQYLKNKKLIEFQAVEDLVVYGASAGGIASLVYGHDIEKFTNQAYRKTMIVDSPGLHFGKDFWKKFDKDMKDDFKKSFERVGLYVDFSDGAVSKKMGPVFESYRDWNMGILLGLRDYAMSKFYGDSTPMEQKKLILSSVGIPAIAKEFPHVEVWLKDTYLHTFLLTLGTASQSSEESDVKAFEFANSIYLK